MIQFDGVSKSYRDEQSGLVHAVRDVSFTIAAGETVCLIGTSGCGKTTTLKLMNRLERPTAGSIRVADADIANQDPVPLRRRMGYVIQSGGLFPHMTVADNVGLLCKLEGWPQARIAERVNGLLELVNLDPALFAARYPGSLSGGQRQRVGVARALALDPPILLMDEPFGALDPITREQLHEEFMRVRARLGAGEPAARGKTIVLVTHDLAEAFKLADRVALMDGGRVVQFAPPTVLRDQPVNDFVADFVRGQGKA